MNRGTLKCLMRKASCSKIYRILSQIQNKQTAIQGVFVSSSSKNSGKIYTKSSNQQTETRNRKEKGIFKIPSFTPVYFYNKGTDAAAITIIITSSISPTTSEDVGRNKDIIHA